MNIISSDVAKQFCELCNWSYECWRTHKLLFDDNKHIDETVGKAKDFTSRLAIITQEYVLLQISKLHDPSIQGKSLNLTIHYIDQYGNWEQDADTIRDLVSRLTELFNQIKSVRNKILAHNDLEVHMANTVLGAFPQYLDEKYFDLLQQFASVVHQKWFDCPYRFNDLVESDVEQFLHVLKMSRC